VHAPLQVVETMHDDLLPMFLPKGRDQQADQFEMGESPLMRDGWAVLQPTLTAQPSRSTQRTGPAVLLFLPALRALDFWDRFLVMMFRVTTLVW
jgi:hypothetical protein